MQYQNCNSEEMVKGAAPTASQKGKLTVLAYQIPAMACPAGESFVLDESVEMRVA